MKGNTHTLEGITSATHTLSTITWAKGPKTTADLHSLLKSQQHHKHKTKHQDGDEQ